jgi:alpha-glucosidase
LALYRAALALRRSDPALGAGLLGWLDSPPETLAFERRADGTGSRLVCVVNLGTGAQPVSTYGEIVLASGPLTADGALPPDTAVWLRPAAS